jgi:hypothetical protein
MNKQLQEHALELLTGTPQAENVQVDTLLRGLLGPCAASADIVPPGGP